MMQLKPEKSNNMKKPVKVTIEGLIRLLAKKRGLQLKQVAERSSMSPQNINGLLTYGNMGILTVIKLFKGLDSDLIILVDNEPFKIVKK